MQIRRHLTMPLIAAMLAALAVAAPPAMAASQTYLVTKVADTADGTCDADCSLREAITAANANSGHDTITLPAGTYLLTIASTDEDANADGDLDISDDVTINGAGEGTTTIDAGGDLDGDDDGDHRVVDTTTDIALGITNVTLTGGDIAVSTTDETAGGAIFLEQGAVLSLDGVTIDANRATGDSGGVDAMQGGALIRIESSTFSDNSADEDGGALAFREGSLYVRDSEFTGNTADVEAGAIHAQDEANMQMWNTRFHENEAGTDGGGMAIGTTSYGAQLQCWDCSFTNNSSGNDGGGLFLDSNENLVEMWDATFRGNVAEDDGGGLWLDESVAIILGGTFEDNHAYDEGGGISGEEVFLILRDVDIVDNRAFNPVSPTNQTEGGGISNEEDYGDIILERVRIEGNSATRRGGGLALYETSVHIMDSSFINNRVEGTDLYEVEGGAIGDNNESRIIIERTLFEDNTVSGPRNAKGGAIYREEGPTTIVDSTFRGNSVATAWTADDTYRAGGGALYSDYGSGDTPIEVRRSLFEANSATGDAGATAYGGAMYIEHNTTNVVTNATFVDNSALTAGGAFHMQDSGRVRVQSSTVTGNTAPDGGAFFLAADTGGGPGQANVKGSLLQDNGDTCGGEDLVSGGWNIADDATCALDEPTDLDDTAAAYESLAENGGPTMTQALPPTSIAVDGGAPACTDVAGVFPVAVDQRGAGRPVDGDGDGTAACDVGAFEYQEAVTVVASDPEAHESPAGGDDGLGTFTFSRPGTDGDLEVAFTVGGSATSGDDYAALTGLVTIPDGAASATVHVAPVEDLVSEGPETVAVTLSPMTEYVVGSPSEATVTIKDAVAASERFAGDNRIETAVAVSNGAFGPDGAGAVVLTRSDIFPDALAGTPLAAANDAPILLTPPTELLSLVEEEIERVLPDGGRVYLLGGQNALAPSIEARLDALGYDTERLQGSERIGTSIAIANELGDPDTLLLTTGFDFPDALAAGAAAAGVDGAVILTTPDRPSSITDAYLASNAGATQWAIGGPAARAYPAAQPLVGANRVATAIAAAEEFFDGPPAAGLAVLNNFPDALAGGAHVAANGGPLLLTGSDGLHDDVHLYLCANESALDAIYVYGGVGVLSQAVFEEGFAAISGTSC